MIAKVNTLIILLRFYFFYHQYDRIKNETSDLIFGKRPKPAPELFGLGGTDFSRDLPVFPPGILKTAAVSGTISPAGPPLLSASDGEGQGELCFKL
jgi:hypothetical protein